MDPYSLLLPQIKSKAARHHTTTIFCGFSSTVQSACRETAAEQEEQKTKEKS